MFDSLMEHGERGRIGMSGESTNRHIYLPMGMKENKHEINCSLCLCTFSICIRLV